MPTWFLCHPLPLAPDVSWDQGQSPLRSQVVSSSASKLQSQTPGHAGRRRCLPKVLPVLPARSVWEALGWWLASKVCVLRGWPPKPAARSQGSEVGKWGRCSCSMGGRAGHTDTKQMQTEGLAGIGMTHPHKHTHTHLLLTIPH